MFNSIKHSFHIQQSLVEAGVLSYNSSHVISCMEVLRQFVFRLKCVAELVRLLLTAHCGGDLISLGLTCAFQLSLDQCHS